MSTSYLPICQAHLDDQISVGFRRGNAALWKAIQNIDALIVAREIKDSLHDFTPGTMDELIDWLIVHRKCPRDGLLVIDEYGREDKRPLPERVQVSEFAGTVLGAMYERAIEEAKKVDTHFKLIESNSTRWEVALSNGHVFKLGPSPNFPKSITDEIETLRWLGA